MEPQFEGQTKTKLGNSEVRGAVETAVNEQLAIFLDENPKAAKSIIEKAVSGGPGPGGGTEGPGPGAEEERTGERGSSREAGRLLHLGSLSLRALHRRG